MALAGFSGIVVAFRQARVKSWPPQERLRLRNMVEMAAYSVLFALVPFVPHHLGARSEVTWSLCSFGLAGGLGGDMALTRIRMSKQIRRGLSAAWLQLYLSGTAVVCALLLVNALGLVAAPQLGIYLVGLGWALFISLAIFVRLVVAQGAADSAAGLAVGQQKRRELRRLRRPDQLGESEPERWARSR